jgi:hypothetical protein
VPAAASGTRNGPPLSPLSLSHAERWLDPDSFWAQLDLKKGGSDKGDTPAALHAQKVLRAEEAKESLRRAFDTTMRSRPQRFFF